MNRVAAFVAGVTVGFLLAATEPNRTTPPVRQYPTLDDELRALIGQQR